MRGILAASFADIESDLSSAPVSPEQKEKFSQLQSEMEIEVSFFLLVTFPCWLLYQNHPTRLYRQARLGDVKAIRKLLSLDALLIHDASIGRQIQALRLRRQRNTYENLMEAPLKLPKAKITRKKVKEAFAGLISALAKLIKHPLTEPEIRALFDAVAQDAGQGPIDTDLLESSQGFAKAIQRNRTFWIQGLSPDK